MNPWDRLLDAPRSTAVTFDRPLLDFALVELMMVLSRVVEEKTSTLRAPDTEEILKESIALLCRPAVAHRIDLLVRLAARIGLVPGAVAAFGLRGTSEVSLVSTTWSSPRKDDLRPVAIRNGASRNDAWYRSLPVGALVADAEDLTALAFELGAASPIGEVVEGSVS